MKPLRRTACIANTASFLFLYVVCRQGFAQPVASFTVGGLVAAPTTYTAAKLAADFGGKVRTISYTLKGAHHTARAVALEAIIEAAKPQIDPHVKHGLLKAVVSVTGSDGYTVVFSLGELSPVFGNKAVWVALDEDGKPLNADDGPVELVVPGDVKAGRWVHSVVSVNVSVVK